LDRVRAKALSARLSYQAGLKDLTSERTPFREVSIREIIRSNRARGPSRYLHKIILVHTNTHINIVITRLSVE